MPSPTESIIQAAVHRCIKLIKLQSQCSQIPSILTLSTSQSDQKDTGKKHQRLLNPCLRGLTSRYTRRLVGAICYIGGRSIVSFLTWFKSHCPLLPYHLQAWNICLCSRLALDMYRRKLCKLPARERPCGTISRVKQTQRERNNDKRGMHSRANWSKWNLNKDFSRKKYGALASPRPQTRSPSRKVCLSEMPPCLVLILRLRFHDRYEGGYDYHLHQRHWTGSCWKSTSCRDTVSRPYARLLHDSLRSLFLSHTHWKSIRRKETSHCGHLADCGSAMLWSGMHHNITNEVRNSSSRSLKTQTTIMLFSVQQFAMRSILMTRTTATELHDVAQSWAGLGSAISNLYQQIKVPSTMSAPLVALLYLSGIAGLHITTPALFGVEVFTSNASVPVMTRGLINWTEASRYAALRLFKISSHASH